MTTPTRLERTLPTILDELASGPTPEYLDDVFARTAPMRQRPGWTFPERWLPMADITRSRALAPAPPWRLLAIALIVIALVAVALLAYAGAQRRVPAPFGPARNGFIPYEKGGDIYVGDPVTGESRLVLGGPTEDTAPGFSPDGTLIAFFRSADAVRVDMYVMDADGGGLRKVTAAPLTDVSSAQFTPESRHILAIHPIAGKRAFELFDVNGPGKSIDRLAADIDVSSFAFRPPAGNEILFRGIEHGRLGLYAMNMDGTNIHSLLVSPTDAGNDNDLANATYSADGARVFYQAAIESSPENACCQLWVMDADGRNQHRFPTDVAAKDVWEGEAAVSPDGKWVAFWRVGATGRVTVLRADGTGDAIATGPDLSGTAGWVWAPDSSKILMVPNDAADSPRHYLLDPAGGQWSTTAWEAPTEPDWQRDAP
ncbi:MAG: TolB family protein [Chloroflexota bacterium]